MTIPRPTINLDAPPGYHELHLDTAYDRLAAARERQDRAEASIADAYRAFVLTAASIPTSGVNLDKWLDRHTEAMASVVAEIRARVVADDDAKHALAAMKGGA